METTAKRRRKYTLCRITYSSACTSTFCSNKYIFIKFSSIQSLSRVWLFVTPWIAAHQASLSITNSWSLLKLMSIEPVMPSNNLILCRPLLLPSIFPSIRVFSNESVLHIRRPKYWSFSFNISPSNEYSGLIYFRMDWLDLLEVQGTLKSLLQYHSSKASILRSQDGGGIGRGDHFLFYKFIERTERWRKFTKQLLIASRGHQAPRKAAHCLRREVGQKY